MPKEVVHTAMHFFPDSIEVPTEHPVTEVRWSREAGHVQIVTRIQEYEVYDPETAGLDAVKYGMYVDLDRRGINDLIRHLRRARDQAFGRDE